MRPVVYLISCMFLMGCSAAPSDEAKKENDSPSTASRDETDRPVSRAPEGSTTAVKTALDALVGSYRGSEVEILSWKEQAVDTAKTKATALHLQWRLKGQEERNEILLVQSDRVIYQADCDPNKSFEANVAAAVQQFNQ